MKGLNPDTHEIVEVYYCFKCEKFVELQWVKFIDDTIPNPYAGRCYKCPGCGGTASPLPDYPGC